MRYGQCFPSFPTMTTRLQDYKTTKGQDGMGGVDESSIFIKFNVLRFMQQKSA